MKIDRIHHVAYRCRDAKETVEWYGRVLKMDFQLAIAEDRVPSTKEPDPRATATPWPSSSCPPRRPWAATRTRPCGCSTSPSA
jgi:hypothetical protein